MLAIIATVKVKPGMEKDFEAEAKAHAAKVIASEPGCKLYALCRSEHPGTYVFMERYVDQAAVEAHRTSPLYKEVGPKIGKYVEGPVDVQRLTEL